MKKSILLLATVLLFSCNKNDDSSPQDDMDSGFLLSEIIYDEDNIEVPFDTRYKYEYNSNNNPIELNATDGMSNLLHPMLEFNYDNGTLKEIIHVDQTYWINGQYVAGYEKHTFTSFDLSGASSRMAFFDINDNLLYNHPDVTTFTFDGNLIKSMTISSTADTVVISYSHDNEGKIVQITMGSTLDPDPIVVDVIDWDDNPNIDTFGPLSYSLGKEKFWLPNHYISTKNPINYTVNPSGGDQDITVAYQYDANGNIEKQEELTVGFSSTRIMTKKYVPRN